jgi:hypothetical protein
MLDGELTALVHRAAPRTVELLGVGTIHAAQLLVTAGQNVGRLARRPSPISAAPTRSLPPPARPSGTG